MKTSLAILALLLATTAHTQDKPQWCASASLIWDGAVATLVCIDRHGNMAKVRDFPRRWLPDGRSEVRIDIGKPR